MTKPPFAHETAIGAIRLAMEGGKDDATRLRLISSILDHTDGNDLADISTVEALMYVLRETGGRLEVADAEDAP